MTIFVLSAALAGCSAGGPGASEPAAAKPVVYTVNYPLQYFAQRISDGLVEVRLPAPPGEDPAYWEPDTETIRAYQQADLILLNGAKYAEWVDKVSLPTLKLVNTSASFRDRYIELGDLVTHSHGPEGEHAHGGAAFTTWLDPALAALHADAVAAAITALTPESKATLQQNLAALKSDLGELDHDLRGAASGYHRAPLLASHPVYQYLARAYDLNLRSMHWEPDEMPSEEEWSRLAGLLKEHPANWMIWEAPPSANTAARLEKMGVRPVVFYPCGNVPESGDYLSVMKENIERLKPALE